MTAAGLTSKVPDYRIRNMPQKNLARQSSLLNLWIKVMEVLRLSKLPRAKPTRQCRATSIEMGSQRACPKFMTRHLKGSPAARDNSWTTWLPASRCVRAPTVDSERSTWGDVQKSSRRNTNVYTIVASNMPPMQPWTCTWERSTTKWQRRSEIGRPEKSLEQLAWRAILISWASSRP